jgi:hypothetical protein
MLARVDSRNHRGIGDHQSFGTDNEPENWYVATQCCEIQVQSRTGPKESNIENRSGRRGRKGDQRDCQHSKDYPLTGSDLADTVSLKRIDAHTSERTDKKGGKIVQTFRRVVSKDGKTMTVTIKGTNAQGQTVNNVVVFEKQ